MAANPDQAGEHRGRRAAPDVADRHGPAVQGAGGALARPSAAAPVRLELRAMLEADHRRLPRPRSPASRTASSRATAASRGHLCRAQLRPRLQRRAGGRAGEPRPRGRAPRRRTASSRRIRCTARPPSSSHEAWATDERPRADAIVTATRGMAVGVLTADCAPVLFADAEAGVVAAAHAGWRGALGGVLEATIAGHGGLGARRRASVRPSARASARPLTRSGSDFEQEFLERDPASAGLLQRAPSRARGRTSILPGYVAAPPARAGIASRQSGSPAHMPQRRDFFSYRRSQARREPDYGRQISAIVLT